MASRRSRSLRMLLIMLCMLLKLLLPSHLGGPLVGKLLLQGEEQSHEVAHGGPDGRSLLLLGELGQVQDVGG